MKKVIDSGKHDQYHALNFLFSSIFNILKVKFVP
jgi:hypothetical protein